MAWVEGQAGFWEDPVAPLLVLSPKVCLLFRRDRAVPQELLCSSELLRFFLSMSSASTSTQAPAQAGKSMQPLVAQGDWTKNLVQLAKTAELK